MSFLRKPGYTLPNCSLTYWFPFHNCPLSGIDLPFTTLTEDMQSASVSFRVLCRGEPKRAPQLRTALLSISSFSVVHHGSVLSSAWSPTLQHHDNRESRGKTSNSISWQNQTRLGSNVINCWEDVGQWFKYLDSWSLQDSRMPHRNPQSFSRTEWPTSSVKMRWRRWQSLRLGRGKGCGERIRKSDPTMLKGQHLQSQVLLLCTCMNSPEECVYLVPVRAEENGRFTCEPTRGWSSLYHQSWGER